MTRDHDDPTKRRLSQTARTAPAANPSRRRQSYHRPKLTLVATARFVRCAVRIRTEGKKAMDMREKAYFRDVYYTHTDSLQSVADIDNLVCGQGITVPASVLDEHLSWSGWREGQVMSLYGFLKLVTELKSHLRRTSGQELQQAFQAMHDVGATTDTPPPPQAAQGQSGEHDTDTASPPLPLPQRVTGDAIKKACSDIGLAVSVSGTKQYDFQEFATALVGETGTRGLLKEQDRDVAMQEMLYHGEKNAMRLMGCRRTSNHPHREVLKFRPVDDVSVIAEQVEYLKQKRLASRHPAAIASAVALSAMKMIKAVRPDDKAPPPPKTAATPVHGSGMRRVSILQQPIKKPNFTRNLGTPLSSRRSMLGMPGGRGGSFIGMTRNDGDPLLLRSLDDCDLQHESHRDSVPVLTLKCTRHDSTTSHPIDARGAGFLSSDGGMSERHSESMAVVPRIGNGAAGGTDLPPTPEYPAVERGRGYARAVRDWRNHMTLDEVRAATTPEQFARFCAIKRQLKQKHQGLVRPVVELHPTLLRTDAGRPPELPRLKGGPLPLCITSDPDRAQLDDRVKAWLRHDSLRRATPAPSASRSFYKSRAGLAYS